MRQTTRLAAALQRLRQRVGLWDVDAVAAAGQGVAWAVYALGRVLRGWIRCIVKNAKPKSRRRDLPSASYRVCHSRPSMCLCSIASAAAYSPTRSSPQIILCAGQSARWHYPAARPVVSTFSSMQRACATHLAAAVEPLLARGAQRPPRVAGHLPFLAGRARVQQLVLAEEDVQFECVAGGGEAAPGELYEGSRGLVRGFCFCG